MNVEVIFKLTQCLLLVSAVILCFIGIYVIADEYKSFSMRFWYGVVVIFGFILVIYCFITMTLYKEYLGEFF